MRAEEGLEFLPDDFKVYDESHWKSKEKNEK
jgi:hypothetical protein